MKIASPVSVSRYQKWSSCQSSIASSRSHQSIGTGFLARSAGNSGLRSANIVLAFSDLVLVVPHVVLCHRILRRCFAVNLDDCWIASRGNRIGRAIHAQGVTEVVAEVEEVEEPLPRPQFEVG